MPQTFTGEVRNGVVVFDPDVSPPIEGTRVRVELVETPEPKATSDRHAALFAMIGLIEKGPIDASIQHDERPGERA